MSKFVCKDGELYLSGTAFSDNAWCAKDVVIDISVTTAEFACYGEDGWADVLAGVRSAVFTWTTAYDDTLGIDLDNTVGQSGTLLFDTVDGQWFAATVVITGVSVNATQSDIAVVEWEATCDGILVES